MSTESPSPVTNGDTTDKRTAAQPPQTCPHDNERCPVDNASSETDPIPCWPCRLNFGSRDDETDAWTVAL